MSITFRPGPGCLLCNRAAWRHPSADCAQFVSPGAWWERLLVRFFHVGIPRRWK